MQAICKKLLRWAQRPIAAHALCLLFTFHFSLFTVSAQRNSAYEAYIKKYQDVAVKQMRAYKIPASIILAQGLLESGAGQSELAKKSNNHFGIKQGTDWKGKTVKHDDDRKGEKFRVYKSVEDSYDDHSQFLLKERYQRLFRLSILDYKGWARGLKACGYATDPHYADKLIAIVETYRLDDLDEDPNYTWKPRQDLLNEPEYQDIRGTYHRLLTNNGILCVKAQEGDTWQSLAKEMGLSLKQILKLNEAEETLPIYAGGYIYLEKKATKGPKEMKGQWHKVAPGESMHAIAQLYGIRLANLYKLNYKDSDYQPQEGDLLKVR